MIYSLTFLYLLLTTNSAKEIKLNTTLISEKIIQNNSPPISVDSCNFMDFVFHSNAFVDKSRLIEAVLNVSHNTLLISLPRYWGKTLNLDMLKTFVQIPVDGHGKALELKSTPMYGLFVRGEATKRSGKKILKSKLKTPLLIGRKRKFCRQHLGKYPVIFVDFKDINGTTYDSVIDELKLRIQDAYGRHQYMVNVFNQTLAHENATDITRQHSDSFNKILADEKSLNERGLKNSLKLLSEILYQHYKTDVFIMIDEYDAPSNVAFSNYDFDYYDREPLLDFYRDFLVATFKQNDHLFKGILTGRFPLLQEFVNSAMKDTAEYTFLNGEFMEYYGFEDRELTQLATVWNISVHDLVDKADQCFGYYQFPEKKLFVYNPRFISRYFAENMQFRQWLDADELFNFLSFFAYTGLGQFVRYVSAFRHRDGFGTALDPVHLHDGHFDRHELNILYKALRCRYTPARFGGIDFDLETFPDKSVIFLYFFGHFAITKIDDVYTYVQYPIKDEEVCKKFTDEISNNIIIKSRRILLDPK